MTARVECVVTSGFLSQDEESPKIQNNVWIVGDHDEVVVIDPGHDADTILAAVGDREILAVICTHGHGDHVNAALEVAERDEAPIALHPRDRVLWDAVYEDEVPDIDIEHGGVFQAAGTEFEVLHTPGHTPGGVSLYAAEMGAVFAGDTLGRDGPGGVEGSYGDYPTLLTAIGEQLLTLPRETRVLPGHGEETTVAAEDEKFDTWVSSDGSESL